MVRRATHHQLYMGQYGQYGHGTLGLSHTAATMGKADYTNGVTNLVINWDDADGEYCAGQVTPT